MNTVEHYLIQKTLLRNQSLQIWFYKLSLDHVSSELVSSGTHILNQSFRITRHLVIDQKSHRSSVWNIYSL